MKEIKIELYNFKFQIFFFDSIVLLRSEPLIRHERTESKMQKE